MTNNIYDTLTEATEKLKERGFTDNFEINEIGMLIAEDGSTFNNNEVILEEFHRFEGMSNPSDSSIIYALKTKSGIKGVIIDAYGADASTEKTDFLNNISQNQYE